MRKVVLGISAIALFAAAVLVAVQV